MSNANHHRYEPKNEEFLPLLNWRTISGLILLVIFAVFMGYDFIVQSPKAKSAQSKLEVEFKSIESLPNSNLVRYNSSRKTSSALVSWGSEDCSIIAKGGWVKQTIPVSLFFMAFGTFFTVNAIDIGKNAWTKDEIEYRKWIRWRNRIKSENNFIPRKYSLWNDRIFSIVGFIMGLFAVWVGAFSLWRNIFGG